MPDATRGGRLRLSDLGDGGLRGVMGVVLFVSCGPGRGDHRGAAQNGDRNGSADECHVDFLVSEVMLELQGVAVCAVTYTHDSLISESERRTRVRSQVIFEWRRGRRSNGPRIKGRKWL